MPLGTSWSVERHEPVDAPQRLAEAVASDAAAERVELGDETMERGPEVRRAGVDRPAHAGRPGTKSG